MTPIFLPAAVFLAPLGWTIPWSRRASAASASPFRTASSRLDAEALDATRPSAMGSTYPPSYWAYCSTRTDLTHDRRVDRRCSLASTERRCSMPRWQKLGESVAACALL